MIISVDPTEVTGLDAVEKYFDKGGLHTANNGNQIYVAKYGNEEFVIVDISRYIQGAYKTNAKIPQNYQYYAISLSDFGGAAVTTKDGLPRATGIVDAFAEVFPGAGVSVLTHPNLIFNIKVNSETDTFSKALERIGRDSQIANERGYLSQLGNIGKENIAATDRLLGLSALLKGSTTDIDAPLLLNTYYGDIDVNQRLSFKELSEGDIKNFINEDYDRFLGNVKDRGGIAISDAEARKIVDDIFRSIANSEIHPNEVNEIIRQTLAEIEGTDPWLQQNVSGVEYVQNISSTTINIYDNLVRYGLQADFASAERLARQVVTGDIKLSEIVEELQDQSYAQYPSKPRDIRYDAYATPYANLEREELGITSGVYSDRVKGYLQNNSAPSIKEFRRELREAPEWWGTDKAQEVVYGGLQSLAQRMGF